MSVLEEDGGDERKISMKNGKGDQIAARFFLC
jgi:hypothetical protein